MILNPILSNTVTFICILVGVAFFTLLERKGLGYFQARKGPNKIRFLGFPQPLADAIKLFTKEITSPTSANQSPYFLAPVLRLILALLIWQIAPYSSNANSITMGLLFFLCISSINVYGTLVAGWASNSKYALLGAIRAIAQTISYEVRLAIILLFILFITQSFNTYIVSNIYPLIWPTIILFPLSIIWLISCIAETNRAPFDFAEGESELVSGFNVEYGAGGFALLFLAEYANILIIRLLTSLLFFGGSSPVITSDLSLISKTLLFAFIFIWFRATLPRYRYDLLINLTWKSFLPFSLVCLILASTVPLLFYEAVV